MKRAKQLIFLTTVSCFQFLTIRVEMYKKVESALHNVEMKQKDMKIMQEHNSGKMSQKRPNVFKKVLDNGMTVLVRSTKIIPKVSIQIWYNVGSKDEKDGEKGIAHLIEHMIFKGTKRLSESDINLVVHKLSGRCNAFTAYDYTGYMFDMPTHHWEKVLPIIADCMTGASFKDEHLNSEMKAVIQELKMIRDQHMRSLAFDLMGIMFAGHPYHYPLIGYKQDLWTVRGKDLHAFYKKHYLPNNAALIVAGDVQPEKVFALAQKYFGAIPAKRDYKKEIFHLPEDIVSRSLRVHRDIQLPIVMTCFRIPGARQKIDHLLDIIALALVNSKSSRLHKKLVDDLQLVTSIAAFNYSLFDHGIFFITFEPKRIGDIEKIEAIIFEEIKDVAVNGLQQKELARSLKKAQMAYYSKLEDIQKQASDIGKCFLATGDAQYAFNYLDVEPEEIQKNVKWLLSDYFRKTVLHRGMILPLPKQERKHWENLQAASDELDSKILSARVRTTSVEGPKYTDTVTIEEPGVFEFPKPESFTLSNGIKVFHYHNDNTPKINLVLSLKARGYYDQENKQGLYNFVTNMLTEGTENYTAEELADAIESRGMSFNASPGVISMSMLSQDFEKGLEILQEVVSRAIFENHEIEKVREQILADIKEFWDDPVVFSNQLISQKIYEGHPYSKNILGTKESVEKISQKDLKSFYKRYFSPDGARLAVVGDLAGYDVHGLLEKKLAAWSGPKVENIEFPLLSAKKAEEVEHYINRDQVVLCFAGLSIDRTHEDYEKLWLFDQIFGGGSLGSMSSRLIQLREQSGLFYAIGGSLVAGASEQPGMVIVKTLVSLDRLKEAEEVIKKTMDSAVASITKQEFAEARRAIVNSLIDNFESNAKIALAFLFLDKYDLPSDYFDKRADALMTLNVPEVQKAVKRVLNSNKVVTLRIGRVGKRTA